ncbi:MAG: hypothetical protein H8F28_24765 [Fibrella sp.]|nr:hypothetical protein [Armatimonadota bacterium]
MTNTTPEMKSFAEEAGFKPQDMPPANHPLFENNAEVRSLGDIVDARTEGLTDDIDEGDRDDASTGKTSFDALDEEDEYMTRADFEDSMLSSDPDSEAGDDSSEMIAGAGLDRAPDITGTVRGLAPGMSTHLPLDLGADGFQIIEPEDAGDLRASAVDVTNYNLADSLEEMAEIDPYNATLADSDSEDDGHRIPVGTDGKVMSTDDTLDATRRLQ